MAESREDLTPTAEPALALDEDAPGPPISVPEESTEAGEGGKLKMIVQLVKKCLGVKDIAAMCVLRNHHRWPRHRTTDQLSHIGAYRFQLPCSNHCQTWSIGITSIGLICSQRTSYFSVALYSTHVTPVAASTTRMMPLSACLLRCGFRLPRTSSSL